MKPSYFFHHHARHLLAFLMGMSVTLFASALPVLHAQTSRIDELRESITTREQDIKRLEAEITEYKNRLIGVGEQKKSLQNALTQIELSRAKLGKDIELTQKRVSRTEDTLDSLTDDITDKEKKIEQSRKVIAEIFNRTQRADGESMLEILLAHESISTFLSDLDDMDKLRSSMQDHIVSLGRLKEELAVRKDTVLQERKSLVSLKSQLDDQKAIAEAERKERATLLAATKNQESNYKKLLAEREKRKKQFEAEVDDFEAQLRAEIDPTSFPSPGTRVLSAPLDDLRITQKFGRTVDARRLYTSGTHNGTDFRAAPGTVVRAAASGVVLATGDTDKVCPGASYGRWVMVKHRNGLSTLYAHLELIKVRTGANIDAGEMIGYSGNTGYSTGPHLHFTVYVSSAVDVVDFPSKSCKGAIFRIPVAPANAYLDPEDYL
jgi:murein DD-endopeptidase MepM/ murein hydrolase activator NlpD